MFDFDGTSAVHYVGTFLDGKVFYSTRDHKGEPPATLTINEGERLFFIFFFILCILIFLD